MLSPQYFAIADGPQLQFSNLRLSASLSRISFIALLSALYFGAVSLSILSTWSALLSLAAFVEPILVSLPKINDSSLLVYIHYALFSVTGRHIVRWILGLNSLNLFLHCCKGRVSVAFINTGLSIST